MKIKTFGKLTELTGGDELFIAAANDTDALKASLIKDFPALANMKFFIAVDNKMILENTPINEGSMVALLPPFSGG